MKYALIGWNDKRNKRGAYTEAYNLEKHYPNIIKTFDGNTKINMDEIRQIYDRIIFTYQNPNNMYGKKILSFKYYDTDIVYIRKNIPTIFKYKTTNGFSMFLENPIYINYVPMMIPMYEPMPTTHDKIILGYYIRPQYRPDDFKMFCNFISNLKYDVELYVMGGFSFSFREKSKHIKKLIYTTDNKEFYDNITHYVYSESIVFDPWPTTLQEAVNANKQIIILKQNRAFRDGISDIYECINYHTELNPDIYYDNTNSIINTWNYDNFYQQVFDNRFEYCFDRNKYKYLDEWLAKW